MQEIEIPKAFGFLFDDSRIKVAYGGRGGAKSESVARYLLIKASQNKENILCAREFQRSIKDSVHSLLADIINSYPVLSDFYEVLSTEIRGRNGSTFIFGGLKHNIQNIKSMHNIKRCWVEEAQTISYETLQVLFPTIRAKDSEIIFTMNPILSEDPVYQELIIDPPDHAVVKKISYRDNPYFPEVLEQERIALKARDPIAYDNVWEGNPRASVDGAVYKKELDQAQQEGRITTLEYDESKPCSTYWDIGHADCMSIWIEQKVGQNRYLIDFIQGQYEKVPYYIEELQKRGYNYALHVLPHDAKQDRANAEFTTHDMVARAFPNARVHVNPNFAGAVKAGIQAVRNVFPFLYFDKEKCREGLYSLKMYHYRVNASGQVYGEEPSHDFSDAPDALRMLAMAFRQSDKKAPSPKKKHSIYAR